MRKALERVVSEGDLDKFNQTDLISNMTPHPLKGLDEGTMMCSISTQVWGEYQRRALHGENGGKF